MTFLNLIGWFMLALPFVIMFIAAFWEEGIVETLLGMFALIVVVSLTIYYMYGALTLIIS